MTVLMLTTPTVTYSVDRTNTILSIQPIITIAIFIVFAKTGNNNIRVNLNKHVYCRTPPIATVLPTTMYITITLFPSSKDSCIRTPALTEPSIQVKGASKIESAKDNTNLRMFIISMLIFQLNLLQQLITCLFRLRLLTIRHSINT